MFSVTIESNIKECIRWLEFSREFILFVISKKNKSLLYTYTKIILVFKLRVCNIVNDFRYFGKNVLEMSSSKLTVLSDRCQKEK